MRLIEREDERHVRRENRGEWIELPPHRLDLLGRVERWKEDDRVSLRVSDVRNGARHQG